MLDFFCEIVYYKSMENIFGERLKKLRIDNNLTQEQLGNVFSVNRLTIVKWEKGTSDPSIFLIKSIADYFNVDINYLIGEDIFTFFLIYCADVFTRANYYSNEDISKQLQLTKWIVFWNELLDDIFGQFNEHEIWENNLKGIGYDDKLQSLSLEYPKDYNELIIDYIIHVDFNGMPNFRLLPIEAEDMLENVQKPQLYYDLLR